MPEQQTGLIASCFIIVIIDLFCLSFVMALHI